MQKKYVKKPIPITACQWLGINKKEIREFTNDQVKFVSHWVPVNHTTTMTEEQVDLYVLSLEGEMHANIGDYIIKGVRGEFYPCDRSIFEQTYEEYVE